MSSGRIDPVAKRGRESESRNEDAYRTNDETLLQENRNAELFRRSQYLLAIAMLLLATRAAWAQYNVAEITSQGQLIPNTNIQWSQRGADQFQPGQRPR